MKKKNWLISGLVAAGITPAQSGSAQATGEAIASGKGTDPDDTAVIRKFAQDQRFHLAQHRSHSSHASHSSHRSGSSGAVRTPRYTPPPPRVPRATPTPYPTPTRNERSTPPSSILPSSPTTAPNTLYIPSRTQDAETPSRTAIETVVCKVQTGLMAYGYYEGEIDCIVGPKTRDALRRFQKDYELKLTGTITPEVLDAFRIVAQ